MSGPCRTLEDWMAAARNVLPKWRSALSHPQASKHGPQPQALRTDIELIQAILRPYTLLEHAEVADGASLLTLLQAIHRGIGRYAENPARIPGTSRLHYCSEALADVERRIGELGYPETGEPELRKRAKADDEAKRISSAHPPRHSSASGNSIRRI